MAISGLQADEPVGNAVAGKAVRQSAIGHAGGDRKAPTRAAQGIEHIDDAGTFVDWVADRLAVGGRAYVEWPSPASLDLPPRFTGQDARKAMQGHVLAQAAVTGRYTLNPAVKL